MKHYILTFLFVLCLPFVTWAHTGKWLVAPAYESIEPLSEKILKVKAGGLFGLMTYDGKECVACQYSEITNFCEDHALLLQGDILKGVVDVNGNVSYMESAEVSIDVNYPYFSEGLIPVCHRGTWGYIDYTCKLVTPCEYKYALPFSCGVAAVIVASGKTYAYIDRYLNIYPLSSDFSRTIITAASSFVKMSDGKCVAAVVVDKMLCFRDLSGHKIPGYPEIPYSGVIERTIRQGYYTYIFDEKFRLVSVKNARAELNSGVTPDWHNYQIPEITTDLTFPQASDGMKGVAIKGEPFLAPQFDQINQLSESLLIASKGKKSGIVSVSFNENFIFSLDKEVLYHHYISHEIKGNLTIPEQLKELPLKLEYADSQSSANKELSVSDGSYSFNYLPEKLNTSESFRFELECGDLKYAETECSVAFNSKSSFAVICDVTELQLDENDCTSISFSVKNTSNEASSKCTVYFDGNVVANDVLFSSNERKVFKKHVSVSLGAEDRKTVSHKVKITESSFPTVEKVFNVNYIRFFEE